MTIERLKEALDTIQELSSSDKFETFIHLMRMSNDKDTYRLVLKRYWDEILPEDISTITHEQYANINYLNIMPYFKGRYDTLPERKQAETIFKIKSIAQIRKMLGRYDERKVNSVSAINKRIFSNDRIYIEDLKLLLKEAPFITKYMSITKPSAYCYLRKEVFENVIKLLRMNLEAKSPTIKQIDHIINYYSTVNVTGQFTIGGRSRYTEKEAKDLTFKLLKETDNEKVMKQYIMEQGL